MGYIFTILLFGILYLVAIKEYEIEKYKLILAISFFCVSLTRNKEKILLQILLYLILYPPFLIEKNKVRQYLVILGTIIIITI